MALPQTWLPYIIITPDWEKSRRDFWVLIESEGEGGKEAEGDGRCEGSIAWGRGGFRGPGVGLGGGSSRGGAEARSWEGGRGGWGRDRLPKCRCANLSQKNILACSGMVG